MNWKFGDYMPEIKITDGAIIGANSVVTKNVYPYTVFASNPAKVIRTRFDDETIDFLLNLICWYWDIKKITENLELL